VSVLLPISGRVTCFCGALLWEDTEFRTEAEQRKIPARRFRCFAGHTHYLNADPPPPPRAGNNPLGITRKPSEARWRRKCRHCGAWFRTNFGKQWNCASCRKSVPCTHCKKVGHTARCPRRRSA
jgi:hypothetical protein